MPNWCFNDIKIYGDSDTISVITSACKRCEGTEERIFKSLIDIPTHMTKEDYDKDWYDIHLNQFGTKWDVTYEACNFGFSENEITLQPETAWSPPIKFLENLVKQYKGIEAYIFYSEPGVGFCGETKIWRDTEDGHVYVDDNEYPYLEGVYLLDREVFWSELDGYIDDFRDTNEQEDENGNKLPITDEQINGYIDDNFNFVVGKDREEIFNLFKEEVNG